MSVGSAVRWSRRWIGCRRLAAAGLYAYDIRLSGGRRRLHLRIAADRSAVLLVDATDAIHLNPTAALLAHLALEGAPVARAARVLRRRFHGVRAEEAQRAAERVYAMVEHLKQPGGACVACRLSDAGRLPLFSMPVSAPCKADLALGYGCNNACSHCYNEARPRGGPPLSVSQWRRVLKRLAAVGVPHVIFTGGEPTLFDGLPELIRAAGALGLVAGVNTNGRRLADRQFAESLAAAGLDHVQITLESHDPAVHNAMTGADSFEETRRGIENSLAAGLHTITNTTLTRQNVDRVGQIVEFLHVIGLRTFAINGMIHAGRGRGHREAVPVEMLAPVLADLQDRARRLDMRMLWYTPTQYCRLSPVELELGARRCNAGEYSICIEPNGDVLPCQSYYTPAGNILRDAWQDIWQSELFLGFRRRVADPAGGGLPTRCWNCPDLPVCAGGCRLEREQEDEGT